MAHVRIPTVLRKHTDGQASLETSGDTVREVLAQLTRRHPALETQLLDGDEVRGFINVYVDDEDIRYLDGLDSRVGADDEVAIMPAVAGGASPTARSDRQVASTRCGLVQPGGSRASTHRAARTAGG